MAAHGIPSSENDIVLAYIDNSNIFINSQQYAARKLGLRFGATQDWRVRVDVGKLLDAARKGREVVRGKLYGSEPPALDTVWKAIRNKRIEVSHSKRSTWNQREKETDANLIGNAIEDLMNHKDAVTPNSAVILFTGDKDMRVVVQTAVKYGWNVEIWSYVKALAEDLKKESLRSEMIKIFKVEDVFDNVVDWARQFSVGKNLPKERTLVVKLANVPKNPDQKLKEMIDITTKETKLPTMGRYIERNLLAIVSIVRPGTKKWGMEVRYDFTRDFYTPIVERRCGLSKGDEVVTLLQLIEEKRGIEYIIEDLEIDDEPSDDGEDIDEEGFITVMKKRCQSGRMYSDKCKWRYRCANGKKCKYSHSELEVEFFKEQLNPKLRRLYKIKPCFNYDKVCCKFMKRSHLCSYAHGLLEAFCLKCEKTGVHWTDECDIY